jgi:hypothetical protein
LSIIGCEDATACANFDVSDREIVTSLGIFACMGAFLLVTFGAIRHKAPIFFGRRRLRNLVRADARRSDRPRRSVGLSAFFPPGEPLRVFFR